jgi:(R,R)-butanediol dehydrogenase/meso-butanediol dehydrogenase/diacetyl reductase
MRTGIVTGTRKFELREVPNPELVAGSAVVDITLCGICGSDISAYRHGDEMGTPYPPALCGHEWTGIVRQIADGNFAIGVGDRVILGSRPPCGMHCTPCLQGHYDACETVMMAFLGSDGFSPHSGGFATSQTVDVRRLSRIPDNITDVQATMAEPATVAAHGIRTSGLRSGERVAVMGAGPIGLFAMQLAKASGASQVFMIEPDAGRREFAAKLGADVVCKPGKEASDAVADLTGGLGLDHVYDCAGAPSTLQDSVALLRRRGTATVIGFATSNATVDPGMWLLKDISVRNSFAFDRTDTRAVLSLISEGKLDVSQMHSATVGLEDAAAAFADLAGGSSMVKVLVDPRA